MDEEQLETFQRVIRDTLDADVTVEPDLRTRGLQIRIALPAGDGQVVTRIFYLSELDMMMAYHSPDMSQLVMRIQRVAQVARREMGEHLVQLAEERSRNRRLRLPRQYAHTTEDLRNAFPRGYLPIAESGEEMRWREQLLEQFDREDEGPLERVLAEQEELDKVASKKPPVPPIVLKSKKQHLAEDPFKCTTTESK